MDNLLALVSEQINPDFIRNASGLIGESEESTQSAISAMVPALMGAIAQKGSTEGGAADLMQMLSEQSGVGGTLENVADILGDAESSQGLLDSGNSLVSGLLGDNVGGMIGMISRFAGIGDESSSKLLGLVMPLVMSVLGKKALGGGLDIGSLMGLLGGQKDFIGAAMPSGLDLGAVSGLMPELPNVNIPDLKVPDVDMPNIDVDMSEIDVDMPDIDMPNIDADMPELNVPHVDANFSTPDVNLPNVGVPDVSVPELNASGGLPKWLLPIIGLIVLVGLLWWFLGGGSTPEVGLPDANIDVPAVELDTDMMASACEGVGSITGAIDGLGEITADTEASVVSSVIATVRDAFDKLSGIAGIASMAGFSQIGDAIATVEGLLDGAEGVLGDSAAEVSTAVSGIGDSVGGISSTLSCE